MKSFQQFVTEGLSNKRLLAHASKLGFREAHKTAGLWARPIKKKKTINTLEGPTTAKKGHWHCVGAAKEHWAQSHEALHSKYTPTRKTKNIKGKAHRYFKPKADQESVHAVQINKPFKVHTSWGKLHGNKGDYLVKKKDSDDSWIVKQHIFHSTYGWKE